MIRARLSQSAALFQLCIRVNLPSPFCIALLLHHLSIQLRPLRDKWGGKTYLYYLFVLFVFCKLTVYYSAHFVCKLIQPMAAIRNKNHLSLYNLHECLNIMDSAPTNGKLFCVNQQHASIHQPTQHIQIYTTVMPRVTPE